MRITSPWTYLFILQDLDLQLAGLELRAVPRSEGQIQHLEAERKSVLLLLPTAVLRPYQRLKDAGVPPPWVAKTCDNRCPGCDGELSFAAVREARIDNAPMRCELCWRLVFWGDTSAQTAR